MMEAFFGWLDIQENALCGDLGQEVFVEQVFGEVLVGQRREVLGLGAALGVGRAEVRVGLFLRLVRGVRLLRVRRARGDQDKRQRSEQA